MRILPDMPMRRINCRGFEFQVPAPFTEEYFCPEVISQLSISAAGLARQVNQMLGHNLRALMNVRLVKLGNEQAYNEPTEEDLHRIMGEIIARYNFSGVRMSEKEELDELYQMQFSAAKKLLRRMAKNGDLSSDGYTLGVQSREEKKQGVCQPGDMPLDMLEEMAQAFVVGAEYATPLITIDFGEAPQYSGDIPLNFGALRERMLVQVGSNYENKKMLKLPLRPRSQEVGQAA